MLFSEEALEDEKEFAVVEEGEDSVPNTGMIIFVRIVGKLSARVMITSGYFCPCRWYWYREKEEGIF